MYSSIDRVDIVADTDSGGRLYIQTDHRTSDEIAEDLPLSVLFALARVLLARRMGSEEGQDFEVRYVLPGEAPPAALQRAVAAAGATMEVGGEMLPIDAGGLDPYVLADRAMAELARQVRDREDLAPDETGLSRFEILCHGEAPDPEEDEIAYWTCRVELAALAGELLRDAAGGRWVEDSHDLSLFPFAFSSADDQLYNVFGRVERLFEQGPEEGPSRLLSILADRTSGEGTIMFSLKPSAFARNEVLCRPILDMDQDMDGQDLDIPVIVYGEDRPRTFAHFPRDEEGERKMEQFHQQALRLLKTVDVEVHPVDLGGSPMVVVTGHYYAAEKLLDESFARRMHEELDAELLLASIPRKGVLFLTPISEDASKFLHVTRMKYDAREQGEPISPTPFVVQDGRIVGLARTRAPSEPPPTQPGEKTGFWGKLFKKH